MPLHNRSTTTIKKSREAVYEEALARTKALDLATMMSDERGDQVQLSGAPEVKSPAIPQFYPETRARFSFLQAILSEVVNFAKI